MTKQALKKIIICCSSFALCLGIMLAINNFSFPSGIDDAQSLKASAAATRDPSKAEVFELVNEFDETDDSCKQLIAHCYDLSLAPDLPDSFEQECLSTDDFSSVYTSGEVIGCVFEGSCEAARAHCEEALARKGWHELSGSNEYASNFYKASGKYHQLVLQYFPTAERTLIDVTITECDRP